MLTACNSYKIEGTSSVSILDGKMLYVKVWEDNNLLNIDSCEIVHGKFSMNGEVDSVRMGVLYMDDQPMMPIVIERGNIQIHIDNMKLTASGTDLNNKLSGFMEKQTTFTNRAEELAHKESQMIMDGKTTTEVQEFMQTESDKLTKEMETLVRNFITENYENVLGPGVFMILSSNMPYPMMTPLIEELLDKAPFSFKNDAYVQEFVKVAKENTEKMKGEY